MSPSLNRLEMAGWAVLASERFRIARPDAVALRELVMRPGLKVPYSRLDKCFGARSSTSAARRLPTYMARLRNALEDVGLPRFAIQNEPGLGYVIPAQHAHRVREIVEGM